MADAKTLLSASTTNYMIAHCSPKKAFKSKGTGTGIQTVDQRGSLGKTWYVCSWKNADQAAKAAVAAIIGANNQNIHYSQAKRRRIFTDGMSSKKSTWADCVSFVEEASRIATGNKSISLKGKWTGLSGGKYATMKKLGYWKDFRVYKKGSVLYTGDFMWHAGAGTHGHIVMVVAGKTRPTTVDISQIEKVIAAGGSVSDGNIESSGMVVDMERLISTLVSSENYKWLSDTPEEEPDTLAPVYVNDNIQRLRDSVEAFYRKEARPITDLMKQLAGTFEQVAIKKYFVRQRAELSSAMTLVEAPFVELNMAGTIIGSYNSPADQYPNFISGLSVRKINGQINQYTINLTYQIRANEDPQFIDKLISKVRFGGTLQIRYGDCSSGKIFRDANMVLMNVSQSRSYVGSKISYTLTATSACTYIGTYKVDYKRRVDKPSTIVKELLWDSNLSPQLLNAFPGMRNKQKVMSAGLIPDDDMELEISQLSNTDPLSYLNMLVGAMQCKSGDPTVSYFITYCDDENNKMGGAYFKISRMARNAAFNHSNVYQLTVGYPQGTPVYKFNITSSDGWSILEENSKANEYLYTMASEGDIQKRYSKALTSSVERRTAGDKNWWDFVTTYPTTAELTLRGLTVPVMVTYFINIDVLFYGQKHMTSGVYMITAQQDTLGPDGFKTTLSLVRVSN